MGINISTGGTTEAIGGNVIKTTNATGNNTAGGVGILVGGDIENYGDMTATGGNTTTDRNAKIGKWEGLGGTGLKSITGTLYNKEGVIRANGGNGTEHIARGGHGIEVAGLDNAAQIYA